MKIRQDILHAPRTELSWTHDLAVCAAAMVSLVILFYLIHNIERRLGGISSEGGVYVG